MHQFRVNYFEDNDIDVVGKFQNNDKQAVRGHLQVEEVESLIQFQTHCFQIVSNHISLD